MSDSPMRLGALLYPGFEMLDLFGPLEMFSILGKEQIQVEMIAQQPGPVVAAWGDDIGAGPTVNATAGFDDVGDVDILLLPGGMGSLNETQNEAMLDFLRGACQPARIVASVCTGSTLLGAAGVIDGLRATTNKQFFVLGPASAADVTWVEEARWVKDGKFYTSSGVSAGMDMALAIIEEHFGADAATDVEKATEYTRQRDPDVDPFHAELNSLAKQMGLV